MIEITEFADLYFESMLEKVYGFANKIKQYSFIKTVEVKKDGNLVIEFTEPFNIEGQDIFDLFIRGGVLKRAESKDNTEENFIRVVGIGEF